MNIDIQNKIQNSQSALLTNKLNNTKQNYESSGSALFVVNEEDFENNVSDEKRKELDRLKEVAKDFEALFVNNMLKEMRKTVNKSNLLEENSGEKIFEDMLYDEYSKEFSKSKTLGVADIIYNNMKYYV